MARRSKYIPLALGERVQVVASLSEQWEKGQKYRICGIRRINDDMHCLNLLHPAEGAWLPARPWRAS